MFLAFKVSCFGKGFYFKFDIIERRKEILKIKIVAVAARIVKAATPRGIARARDYRLEPCPRKASAVTNLAVIEKSKYIVL